MRIFTTGILLITALVACISCNKGELDEYASEAEIKFNYPLTKADYEGNEFRVYAQYSLNSGSLWYDLMKNERVYKSSGGYVYDNTRYWIRDSEYFFVGVSPYVSSYAYSANEYSFVIKIPYAANTDYMVAVTPDEISEEEDLTNKTVDLEFNHCLAMLDFKIKKDNKYNANDKFVIKQIALSGISREGTITVPFNSDFSVEATAENKQILRSGLSKELTADGVAVLGDNGLLVLPQSFEDNKLTLTISYEYKQEGSSTSEPYVIEKSIPSGEWAFGKKYTYSLTISIDKQIYISTPSVETWGVAQSGGTIIIQ